MKICSVCGAAVQDDERFCTNCGAPVQAEAAAVPAQPVDATAQAIATAQAAVDETMQEADDARMAAPAAQPTAQQPTVPAPQPTVPQPAPQAYYAAPTQPAPPYGQQPYAPRPAQPYGAVQPPYAPQGYGQPQPYTPYAQPRAYVPRPQPQANPYGFTSPDPVPMSEWLWTLLLMFVPIANLVMLFLWAFGSSARPSKRNWSRAMLIVMGALMLLGLIITVITAAAMGASYSF